MTDLFSDLGAQNMVLRALNPALQAGRRNFSLHRRIFLRACSAARIFYNTFHKTVTRPNLVNDDGKPTCPSIEHSENGISQLPKTYVSADDTQRPEPEQGSDAMEKHSLMPSSSSEEGDHTPRLSLWDLRCMRAIQGIMKLPLNSPAVAGDHRWPQFRIRELRRTVS